MNNDDRSLGMGREISRRDFINGVTATAGALAVPSLSSADAISGSDSPRDYPPERMGMRGSHPGSFEAEHELRDRRSVDTSGATRTGETYDLVVVGGGLSGLATAHFFLKNAGQDARVLVIDNHDDFGGHAKRNELHYQGRTLVLNGGTLEIESPDRYNKWALQLLNDLDVDLERYVRANAPNEKLYASLGMRSGYFFDKQTFGRDRLVVAPPGATGGRNPFSEAFVRNLPISARAKGDLLRLFDPNQPDYLPGMSSAQKKEHLARISYKDYLLNVAKVDEQAYWFFSGLGRGVFCVGAHSAATLEAILNRYAWG